MLKTRPWVPYLYVLPAIVPDRVHLRVPDRAGLRLLVPPDPRQQRALGRLSQLRARSSTTPRSGLPPSTRRCSCSRCPCCSSISVIVAVLLYERVRGWRIYRSVLFFPYILAVPIVGIVGELHLPAERRRQCRPRRRSGSTGRTGSADSDMALWTLMLVIVWREVGLRHRPVPGPAPVTARGAARGSQDRRRRLVVAAALT